MRLPERLKKIADFIPLGSTVADIGTDHALLPVYLIKQGISKSVIAGDLNRGPLEAAKRNVTEAGLQEQIILRQGNGLDIISPGEADTVVIAGMGGFTIRQILEEKGRDVFGFKRFILQPMNDSHALRKWLVRNGLYMAKEDIVEEDSRLYEIICAVPGDEETVDTKVAAIGPRLFEQRHPLLIKLVQKEIDVKYRIIMDIKNSKSLKTALREKELQEEIRGLEWIIECLSNVKQ